MKKYKSQLQVGSLDSKKAVDEPTPAEKEAPKPQSAPVVDVATAKSEEAQEPYGDLIPFADPAWYQGVSFLYTCQFDLLLIADSITPPTSTRPTLPSVRRSEHMLSLKSSRM